MSQERRFFSGNTLEQAVLQAARHFGLAPEELAYRQIEKRHGFLKGRKRCVIEVSPGSPRRSEGAEEEAPSEATTGDEPTLAEIEMAVADTIAIRPEDLREPQVEERWEDAAAEEEPDAAAPESEVTEEGEAEPAAGDGPAGEGERRGRRRRRGGRRRGGRDRGERELRDLPSAPARAIERFPRAEGPLADAARKAAQQLLDTADLDAEFEVLQGDERLEIEFWGADQDVLLRDRGRVLLAIQHLLPRLIRGQAGDSTAVRVDSDNFHEIREERLRDLAQRVAAEVQQEGRMKTLEPMSPDERRIIHLTLADDATVETESRGQGLFKRVMIRPARRQRSFEPHRR